MDTSQHIVDKAHDLLLIDGLRGISMDKLANSLGISKKTVYQFFSNKDTLVTALIEKEIAVNIAHCESLKAENIDAVLELFFILIYAKEFYKTFSPATIGDLAYHHPDAFKKLTAHQRVLIDIVKANMAFGVKSTLYQNDFNFDIIAEFLLESLTVILNPKLPFISSHPEVIVAYLINGILTTKGISLMNKYKHHQVGTVLLDKYQILPFWDD